jgi:virginiamycin B lyase
VVVIHGIGNQKRNSTLLEAVNALTYWFNHHAGLDLDSEGTGRVWLTTSLRDDDDPDAEASCATLRLVAPSGGDTGQGEPSPDVGAKLRLEFREVWWAESFGIPKVGAALAWARVQFREQLAHLLLPAGFSLGPAQTARRAPAHEIAQALTYQPEAAHPDNAPRAAATRQPFWRGVGLWLYDLVQYVWKLAQWVVLTPLISVLLVLLGLVRLLARIPLLQWSLVASATAIINSVVLHWVASMQVYLLDYGRSAAMRQRFEREVQDFLDDPQCTRIVVIAHSMGTVISYEGLTTLLKEPDWQARAASKQQITYICLAQALRRVWLLSRTDPQRLRGVLPANVRWLHFWARYDPVAVGPLYPDALPPPDPGVPPPVRAADKALRIRLADCENVDVVNTDSIYSDHTTYWQNLEQVVGPIAHELVAGSPALERLVAGSLAPREEVLKRRWRVAWRALVSLAGGFGLAAVLVALDARNDGRLSQAIARLIGGILNSAPVQRFLDSTTFGLTTAIGTYLSQCAHAGACTGLQNLGQNPNLIVPYLFSFYLRPEMLTAAAAVLVVLGVSILLVGKLVAEPSPFAFRGASAEAASTRSVFVLAALALLLSMIGLWVYLFFVFGLTDCNKYGCYLVHFEWENPLQVPLGAKIYLWLLALGELGWFLALSMGFVDAFRGRRWGWIIGLMAGVLIVLAAPLVYALAIATLALAGCLALGIEAARLRRWSWVVGLAAVALPLGLAVGDVLHAHAVSTFGLLTAVAPVVVYALWAGPAQMQAQAKPTGRVRGALGLSLGYLLLLIAGSSIPWVPLIILATLLGTVAWGLSLADAVRGQRWGWVVAILSLTIGLIALTHTYASINPLVSLPAPFAPPAERLLLWSIPFIMAALSYTLWASPTTYPVAGKAARRFALAVPVGLARVATVMAMVALVIPLLVWDVAPSIPTLSTRLVYAEFPPSSQAPVPIQIAAGPGNPYAPTAEQPTSGSMFPTHWPTHIAAGPDGNLWFTEHRYSLASHTGVDGKIGRITPAGAIREFPLPDTRNEPDLIAAGPDGNLWFTDYPYDSTNETYDGGAIGRISPTGTFQEFSLPKSGISLGGIAAGPDRNVWFIEEKLELQTDTYVSDTIGRITPAGVIREYPLPEPSGRSIGIVSGPDGNLWFATVTVHYSADANPVTSSPDYVTSAIWRITPTGTFQEFSPFEAWTVLGGIAAGPGGNIWYTEYQYDSKTNSGIDPKIGRITPAGAIREFPLPNTENLPIDIAAGSDGNLWFTEEKKGNDTLVSGPIGRITPAGAIWEFPLLNTENVPLQIAAGPDGNVWFTEPNVGKIGRILTWLADLGVGALSGQSGQRVPVKAPVPAPGLRITLQASCLPSHPSCPLASELGTVLQTLQRRSVDGLQVKDADVRLQGANGIVINLPGYTDTAFASEVLGGRGELAIIDTGGTSVEVGTKVTPGQYKVLFTWAQLDQRSISADQQTNQSIVTFAFAGDAKAKFAAYTRTHIGQYLTITLDDTVIESAVIQSEINGQGQITGLPTFDDAQALALLLKSQPLPVMLTVVSVEPLTSGG